MEFATILLYAHSGIRWLIVFTAILTLTVFGYAWVTRKSFPKLKRILPSAYSSLLDAQILIGVIYLFLVTLKAGGIPRYRWEHLAVMVLSALLAHLPARWRKSKQANFYRKTFFAVLGSLVLIYIGVANLPGGWNR